MPRRNPRLKLPATVFGISLAATILSLIFIGFPGICGFTGEFGDAISNSNVGFWLALSLTVIPVLVVFLSIVWIIIAVLVRLLPGSEPAGGH